MIDLATSRRRFVQSVALVASAYGMAASAPWAGTAAAAASSGDRVRIGMIGIGDRGHALMLNLQQAANVRIVAVCDTYAPNLARARTATGAAAYTDHRALLDARGLDAVVIATPLAEHAHIVLDALDAGVHVFCEKSMARTPEDCTAMVAKAVATRRILQIGHQRLFNPRYLAALARVRAGDIGAITQVRAYWHRHGDWRRPAPPGLERQINWRLYKATSAGLMTELASHQIQVANWFLDAVPTRVIGSGSICYWRDGREVDDQVALIYDYDGGRKLVYDALISNRHYGLEEQIQGDKGTIEAEIGRFYSEVPEPVPGLQQLLADVRAGLFRSMPIGGASWSPETAVIAKGEPIGTGEYDETLLQLEAFAEAVKAGQPLPGLLREAYHASIGALLGERAMDTGQPVDWPANLVMPKVA